jgi:uncharacterized protein YbaR (Trm112 family)
MYEEVMQVIECPECKNKPLDLLSFQAEEGEIIEGLIMCSECERWFVIRDGVPEVFPDALRDENEDLPFLEKWRAMIPRTTLLSGKPFSLQPERYVKAGRYELAAQLYELMGKLEKAGECRRMDRTNYVISANFQIGNDGTISIRCPHCSGSQAVTSKENNIINCNYCGKSYAIPTKVLGLI